MKFSTTIQENGIIIIPDKIVNNLNLKEHDVVDISPSDDNTYLILTKVDFSAKHAAELAEQNSFTLINSLDDAINHIKKVSKLGSKNTFLDFNSIEIKESISKSLLNLDFKISDMPNSPILFSIEVIW